MSCLENQPIGMDEIDGILPTAIACKLVAALRFGRWYQRQCSGILENRETSHDRLCYAVAVCLLECAGRVEGFGEFAGPKDDFHNEISFKLPDG